MKKAAIKRFLKGSLLVSALDAFGKVKDAVNAKWQALQSPALLRPERNLPVIVLS